MEEIAGEGNCVLSVSIVSHGQISMVRNLLADLQRHCAVTRLEVLLTINIAEADVVMPLEVSFPLRLIVNDQPRGFGDNHNRALSQAQGVFFCVLNPDVRLPANPFPALLAVAGQDRLGIVGPQVHSSDGALEDSARDFPTPARVLAKALFRHRPEGATPGPEGDVDWIAGMCMVFSRATYERLRGFDTRYFLYYEDVDICCRLQLLGGRVRVCSSASIVHDAQRSSHRNVRYLRWHVASMLRFFLSPGYSQIRRRRHL